MDDEISLIPEVYFDVVARFVPGAVFFLGIRLVVPGAVDWLYRPTAHLNNVLITVLALVCIWLTGVLLSVVSSDTLILYRQGFDPYPNLIRCPAIPEPVLLGRFERVFGGLVTQFGASPEQFDRRTSQRIRKALDDRLHCGPIVPTFSVCFDYVRWHVPSAGPSVVKTFAEATCARSLMFGFLLLALLTSTVGRNGWAALVPFMLAMCSSAAFTHYRIQACRRMLAALLEP